MTRNHESSTPTNGLNKGSWDGPGRIRPVFRPRPNTSSGLTVQISKGGSRDSRAVESVRILKMGIHGPSIWWSFWRVMQGSTNHRFRTDLMREAGIHGQPSRSEFWIGEWRDPRTADLVIIFEGKCRDPRTADLVRIFEGKCRDPRTAESVRIFKRVCRDPWTADLVRFFEGKCRDPRTAESVRILKRVCGDPWTVYMKIVYMNLDQKSSTNPRLDFNGPSSYKQNLSLHQTHAISVKIFHF